MNIIAKNLKGGGKTLSYLLAGVIALAVSGAWAHTEVGTTANPAEVRSETGRSETGYYAIGCANGATGTVTVSGDLNVGTWMAAGWKKGAYGELHINSGTVTINGSGNNVTFIGYENGSKGLVTVDGGTLLSKCNLQVGRQGTGTLVVNSGAVTVNSKTYVGNENSSTGKITVNGGTVASLGDAYIGNGSTGTLTINGGSVEVGSSSVQKWTYVGNAKDVIGTINLNGGQLKLAHLRRGNDSSKGSFVFDGGMLVANLASGYGLIDSTLPVIVNLGGGVIDNGGLSVTIAAKFSGSGGMTFSGKGTTRLNGAVGYSGKTAVTPGTTLVVGNETAKNNILANGLVLAGLPEVGQTIMAYTSDLTGADLSKVTCPLAPGTEFEIGGEGNKAIVVKTVGAELENYWTGAANDGDLSNADNWKDGVPTSGNANIFSATPATLKKGAAFAPSSITFLEGSAKVTIEGSDITGIDAITNLSSVSHTINAKVYFKGNIQVKQAAMATSDFTKAHVIFAGGAYAAPGCSLESGESAAVYSRCVFGKYYLASTSENRWTAMQYNNGRRVCVADGSCLYVPYAGNTKELYVGIGARFEVDDMLLEGSSRVCYQNKGEFIVSKLMLSGRDNRFMTWEQGADAESVFKCNEVINSMNGNFFCFGDEKKGSKHVFYIGSGGLKFSDTAKSAQYALGVSHNNNNDEFRPLDSDVEIGNSADDGNFISFFRNVTLCTNDEGNTPKRITIKARMEASYSPKITVSGAGVLQVESSMRNGDNPSIEVKDTATLSLGPDGSLGAGAITLGAGTTLAFYNAGSMLSFANAIILPAEGVATIRIDGKRLRTGDHVIARGVDDDAHEHLNVDLNSAALDGRKYTLKTVADPDDSTKYNLVLSVVSDGFILIVR